MLHSNLRRWRAPAALAALAVAYLLAPSPASAGCGCKKPPPPQATVRPSVTWPGTEVHVFSEDFALGEAYEVRFVSAAGPAVAVSGTGWERRDLADGAVKSQISLDLPSLPLGPAAIEVRDRDGRVLVSVPSDEFTVAPTPVVLSESMGSVVERGYQAAVGADGTVYVGVDVTALREGRTLDVWARDLPLRFGEEDVLFYNVQGFLMQLLDAPVPGLLAYDVKSLGPRSSSLLRYFRHEFETYFAAHEERGTHAVDPSDDSWHLDGTPHIDHNHLIVAIRGVYADGSLPAPGATKPFDLQMRVLAEDVLTASADAHP